MNADEDTLEPDRTLADLVRFCRKNKDWILMSRPSGKIKTSNWCMLIGFADILGSIYVCKDEKLDDDTKDAAFGFQEYVHGEDKESEYKRERR